MLRCFKNTLQEIRFDTLRLKKLDVFHLLFLQIIGGTDLALALLVDGVLVEPQFCCWTQIALRATNEGCRAGRTALIESVGCLRMMLEQLRQTPTFVDLTADALEYHR